MSGYVKKFDDVTTICFLVEDEKPLKTCNEVWIKVKKVMKVKFDSDPVCAKKYLRTKIKSYNTEITINFNDKGLKERIKCAYLSAIERGLLGIFSITVHLPLKYAA